MDNLTYDICFICIYVFLLTVRIVLLGKTGAGKSATGNAIIGGNKTLFKEEFSPASVTRICQSEQTEVNGQRINVIDTVGLSDTTNADIQTKTEDIFLHARDGIDVFLLVIKYGDSLEGNDKNYIKWIKKHFGQKVFKNTIILFTSGDLLTEPKNNQDKELEIYINKSAFLKSLLNQCAGRYHVFNNKVKDTFQVTELLRKIESLRRMNENSRYTEQDYAETQRNLLIAEAAIGGGVGGGVGGVTGAAGATMVAAVTVGKVIIIGAAGAVGGLLLGGFFAYVIARKYVVKNKQKHDKNI